MVTAITTFFTIQKKRRKIIEKIHLFCYHFWGYEVLSLNRFLSFQLMGLREIFLNSFLLAYEVLQLIVAVLGYEKREISQYCDLTFDFGVTRYFFFGFLDFFHYRKYLNPKIVILWVTRYCH